MVFDGVSIAIAEVILYLRKSQRDASDQLDRVVFIHQNIIKYLEEGITVFRNGEVVFASEPVAHITGLTPQEMQKSSFIDLANPEEKPLLIARTRHGSETGDDLSPLRFWIDNKQGEKHYIENTSYTVSTLTDGDFEFIFTRDLTTQKKKEESLTQQIESLSATLASVPGVIIRGYKDLDLPLTFVGEGILELTGYPAEEFTQTSALGYRNLIHAEDRDAFRLSIGENISPPSSYEFTYRILTSGKDIKWVWEQGRITKSSSQPGQEVLEGLLLDVTSRVQATEALNKSERYYQSLANSITDIFMVLDSGLIFTYWNQACEQIIGFPSRDVIGKPVQAIFENSHGDNLATALQEAIERQKPRRLVQKLKFQDEEPFVEVNIYPSENGVAVFGRNVTERVEAEKRLKYLSTHDALTEIYSRTYFEAEMSRLQNSRLFPISIVMADVDGLKFVNDKQGHATGDELLRKTARLLKESFRGEDVVARIGGDEFGILIAHTDEEAIGKAITRVRGKIRAHNQSHPNLKIKLSIGVATSENGEDLEETAKRADKKMYEDKSTHKGDTRELKAS